MSNPHHRRVGAARRLLPVAVLAAAATCAPAAHAKSLRVQMRAACRLNDAGVAQLHAARPDVRTLCQNQALIVARPRNAVWGNCGVAWIYDANWFRGHFITNYGIRLYDGLRYGQVLVGYNNLRDGRSGDQWEGVWPVLWDQWDGGRGWYSTRGLVRGWMTGYAVNYANVVCYTARGLQASSGSPDAMLTPRNWKIASYTLPVATVIGAVIALVAAGSVMACGDVVIVGVMATVAAIRGYLYLRDERSP
jgi:hypothetical protein